MIAGLSSRVHREVRVGFVGELHESRWPFVYVGAERFRYRCAEAIGEYRSGFESRVVLQNAKLKVEIWELKKELIPVEEITHIEAELGSAIRTVVS